MSRMTVWRGGVGVGTVERGGVGVGKVWRGVGVMRV